MKTMLTVHVRAFPVIVQDGFTGQEREELVVLDKARLQAAQLVGQSSKELITRLCAQEGLNVLRIGKPEKQEITVNLEGLLGEFKRYELRLAHNEKVAEGKTV